MLGRFEVVQSALTNVAGVSDLKLIGGPHLVKPVGQRLQYKGIAKAEDVIAIIHKNTQFKAKVVNQSGEAFSPTETLEDAARKKLKLPLKDKLTLATEEDVTFVKELSPKTVKAVEKYLKQSGEEITIVAARPVGKHLLLWVAYPKVLDGGIDLIWSTEDQKCVGTFLGGYRG